MAATLSVYADIVFEYHMQYIPAELLNAPEEQVAQAEEPAARKFITGHPFPSWNLIRCKQQTQHASNKMAAFNRLT
jgi:hypothetical protein